MAALRASSTPISSTPVPKTMNRTRFTKPMLFSPHQKPSSPFSAHTRTPSVFKLFTALSSSPSVESMDPFDEVEAAAGDNKFDWYSNWYPLMPVCDLDKRVPHPKKVMGLDVVVWWDRNDKEWKVFDDACPHRLAPLSEGRIDQWGRLQCVYHGWCFDGSGDCKLIPQAPQDGPAVHTFKKACAAVYPSTVQHDIVWFWPSTDPKYKDVIMDKKPPYIPQLDDPSYTKLFGNRDVAYGYEVLVENLMDPAHVPYAHYGIMRTIKPAVKVDREGGRPLNMSVNQLDENGFCGTQEWGRGRFVAPCIFYFYTQPRVGEGNGPASSAGKVPALAGGRQMALIFICIPVSPGNSRLIWTFPRNFGVWIDKIVPRWMFHIGQNLILDSDLYLLHVEERKIREVGNANWQKACFVPTKSDAFVVAFRRWLNKYGGGQVDWRGKYSGALPPTPPREQLMDRYRTHVVNCQSCSGAYRWLNALEVAMQIISIAMIGVVAAAKQGLMSVAVRSALVLVALACFAASKWLSHFIYKTFHIHDYCHAFR